MKKILHTIIILMLLSYTVKAEYNYYSIEFEVYKTNGDTLLCYDNINCDYFLIDSIESSSYLLNTFSSFSEDKDHITYFAQNINYKLNYDTTKGVLLFNQLLEKSYLATSEIVEVIIIDYRIESYMYELNTEISVKDTSWLKTPQVKYLRVEGFLDYFFYFHKESEEANRLVNELSQMIEQDVDRGPGSTEHYNKYIERLKELKVVVISFGSGC